MKVEKRKVNVALTEDEKKALEFLAYGITLQCGGIACDECPFGMGDDPIHVKCMYDELTALVVNMLNATK